MVMFCLQEHFEGGMQGKYVIQDNSQQGTISNNSSRKLRRRQ